MESQAFSHFQWQIFLMRLFWVMGCVTNLTCTVQSLGPLQVSPFMWNCPVGEGPALEDAEIRRLSLVTRRDSLYWERFPA